MSILKTIQSPADLKRLSPTQFPDLCQELREQIISVVSNVGGHLASNLGVIELTVALHYLLNSPKDKIVWDTSNQAYAHKLLTGRREQFHTLRQYGGLSGLPNVKKASTIRSMQVTREPASPRRTVWSRRGSS